MHKNMEKGKRSETKRRSASSTPLQNLLVSPKKTAADEI